MKRVLPVILLLCFHVAGAQTITPRVVDSVNSKPLAYAIVIYNHNRQVTYTDGNGYFSLELDSIKTDDVVKVQFLGYKQAQLHPSVLRAGLIIKMQREEQSLQPVIVSNCLRTEEFTLNRKVKKVKQYIGPGPETRLVIMSRYYNISGRNSFVKRVSILLDERSPNMQIPIRLRWYEWDNDAHQPGKELTDTSIVVYPYKEGWNEFDVPANTIECPSDWIVFGIEFIYPPEYKKQFDKLGNSDEKLKWLNDMGHRWSLGMQYVGTEDEGSFYIVNNDTMQQYSKKYERYFMRPAVKFTITYCK